MVLWSSQLVLQQRMSYKPSVELLFQILLKFADWNGQLSGLADKLRKALVTVSMFCVPGDCVLLPASLQQVKRPLLQCMWTILSLWGI